MLFSLIRPHFRFGYHMVLGLMLMGSGYSMADIYRSVGADGVPLFSDRPPYPGAQPYLLDRAQAQVGALTSPLTPPSALSLPGPEASPPAEASQSAESIAAMEKPPSIPARAMAWHRMRGQARNDATQDQASE